MSSDFTAGVIWETIRSEKPPQLMLDEERDCCADGHEDVDWELSSLAASLPLKYEYDTATGTTAIE